MVKWLCLIEIDMTSKILNAHNNAESTIIEQANHFVDLTILDSRLLLHPNDTFLSVSSTCVNNILSLFGEGGEMFRINGGCQFWDRFNVLLIALSPSYPGQVSRPFNFLGQQKQINYIFARKCHMLCMMSSGLCKLMMKSIAEMTMTFLFE